ncbi:MAG: peptide deformylase [Acidobacteriota bacterium]|nr:peptide deformylase [Acidobacteriota bacterium]
MRDLILLGNPTLLECSAEVTRRKLDSALETARDLRDTLHSFRSARNWGRAISSPQIGVLKKVIYLEIDQPEVFINPVLSDLSEGMVEIWDDCLSFPDLLVKVSRHRSCRISYRNADWKKVSRVVEGAESELLQHEVDHLNGIVATMRAVDGSQFALQSQREFLGDGGFANVI